MPARSIARAFTGAFPMRPLLATTFAAALAVAAALAFAAAPAAAGPFKLERIKVFSTGIFNQSAAEIASFDPISQRLFVTNSAANTVDIFDLMGGPAAAGSMALGGGGPNSVAVHNGIVAVAVEAVVRTDPGHVQFYDTNGLLLNSLSVGALPDMLTFTPDGRKVLVANEGEPGGAVDPVGSVSIIDLSGGVAAATATTIGFDAFNGSEDALRAQGVRIFPGKSAADDFEPEYIAVAPDGLTAFVALQEANTIAVLDLMSETFTTLLPLGAKDHSLPGNGLEASDRDGAITIANRPVFGLPMPDAIASFESGGETFIVTANEGDARTEDARVKSLTLDPTAFPNAAALQQDANLGRLTVSAIDGDFNTDGEYEALFAYGTRSFSIYRADGTLAFDSGDAFEQIIATLLPEQFNSNNSANSSFDTRSDNKGPEPEGVVLGRIDNRWLAFIGLERIGGVMVYDITDPFAPAFLTYQNDRDFGLSKAALAAGLGTGLGPEGLIFVAAADNGFGVPLVVVTNEVSGTTEVYAVNVSEPALAGLLGAGVVGLVAMRRRKR